MLRSGLWLSGLLAVSAACGGSDFSSDFFGGAAVPTTGGSSTNAGNGGAGGGSTSASGVSVGVGGDSTVGSGGSGAGGSTGGAGGPGGASGPAGNAGTGPGTDGGSRESGSSDASSGDASVNCSALQADVTKKLAAAQVCTPTFRIDGGSGVCQTLVNGLCCHVPVASNDSEATGAYQDALDAFNKNKCVAACLAIPCPVGTPSCKPNGIGPATSFSCQY